MASVAKKFKNMATILFSSLVEISKSKVSLFSSETTTIYATVYCTR